MRIFALFLGLFTSFTSQAAAVDRQKAEKIARETGDWFTYTTGPMASEHEG